MNKKLYYPIHNADLERLKADALTLMRNMEKVEISSAKLYRMVMEILDLREEVILLQTNEKVEQIIAHELDSEDAVSFQWSDEEFMSRAESIRHGYYNPSDAKTKTMRLYNPYAAEKLTAKEGRRMPRIQ